MLDVQKSLDEVVSSPDGTPSFISVEDRLRSRMKSPKDGYLLSVGRDFGGSASGNTSAEEFSAEEVVEARRGKALRNAAASTGEVKKKGALAEALGQSGMGRGAMADALGDQSDVGSDAGSEFEDLKDVERAEKEDKGFKGSVL